MKRLPPKSFHVGRGFVAIVMPATIAAALTLSAVVGYSASRAVSIPSVRAAAVPIK